MRFKTTSSAASVAKSSLSRFCKCARNYVPRVVVRVVHLWHLQGQLPLRKNDNEVARSTAHSSASPVMFLIISSITCMASACVAFGNLASQAHKRQDRRVYVDM